MQPCSLMKPTPVPDLAGILFSTKRNHQYLYDDNTGLVFYCPPVMQAVLRSFATNSKETILHQLCGVYDIQELSTYYDHIKLWTDRYGAFFFQKRPTISADYPDEVKIRDYICKYGFRQLLLTVTEQCNLRCAYCSYSSAYRYNRTHASRRMTMATARRAVDYYCREIERNKDLNPCRRPAISFYGGEPLLEFGLILAVIEYARSRYGQDIAFNMTTNGIRLEGAILDYLMDRDVSISVSLNGPELEHDRLRGDTHGRGSFKRVVRNLHLMRERYPDHPNGRILCCHDFETSLPRVRRFFDDAAATIPPLSRVSMISQRFTDYFQKFDTSCRQRFAREFADLKGECLEKLRQGETPRPGYLENLVIPHYTTILMRDMLVRRPATVLPYSAACVPGMKISVAVDGTFHACEKMNAHFPIGNVKQGLDWKGIRDLMSKYRRDVLNACSACAITRLCSFCYITFSTDGNFISPRTDCERAYNAAVTSLVDIYSVLESNDSAFATFLACPEENA